jgi:hypothetical protein
MAGSMILSLRLVTDLSKNDLRRFPKYSEFAYNSTNNAEAQRKCTVVGV